METLMATATIVIAVFTVVLVILHAWQFSHQKKVARANYLVTLHDKRMGVFNAIDEFLSSFLSEGRPSLEEAVRLRARMRTAHFLFPEEALHFVDEIIDKSFEHQRSHIDWEPLRARAWNKEQLTAEEIKVKETSLSKMHEIERWFLEQVEAGRLLNDLEPYLKLPDSV